MNMLLKRFLFTTLTAISVFGYGYFAFATIIPGQTLDPVFDGLCTGPTDPACAITTGWQLNVADGFVYNTTDMIGIGTDTPGSQLDIVGSYTTLTSNEKPSMFSVDASIIPDQGVNASEYQGIKSVLTYDENSSGHALTWTGIPGTSDSYLNTMAGLFRLNLEGTGNVSRSAAMSSEVGISGSGSYNNVFGTSSQVLLSGNGSVSNATGLTGSVYAIDGSITTGTGLAFNVNGDVYNANVIDLISNGIGINIDVRNVTTQAVGASLSLANSPRIDGTDVTINNATTKAIGYNTVITSSPNGTGFAADIDGSDVANGILFLADGIGSGQACIVCGDISDFDSGYGMLINNIEASDHAAAVSIEADGSAGSPVSAIRSSTGSGYGMRIVYTDNTYPGIEADNVYGLFIQAGALLGTSSEYGIHIADVEAENYLANGVRIGSNINENKIDSSTNGLGSSTLYIGTNTIDTTSPSDERTKVDISDTQYGIETLEQIRVVDFLYDQNIINDNNRNHTGVIAQQVADIYPEALQTRSDGYYMVDYKVFIPLIIKSVQDLNLQMGAIDTSASATQEWYENNDSLIAWFGSITNGIKALFVESLHASQQICIDDVCITKDQLTTILENNGENINPITPGDTGGTEQDNVQPEELGDTTSEDIPPEPEPDENPEIVEGPVETP
jgi:hypothetical protein